MSNPWLSDYPSNTVPNKVEHLFMAQLFHDRKQNEARRNMTPEQRQKTPYIDYLRCAGPRREPSDRSAPSSPTPTPDTAV